MGQRCVLVKKVEFIYRYKKCECQIQMRFEFVWGNLQIGKDLERIVRYLGLVI